MFHHIIPTLALIIAGFQTDSQEFTQGYDSHDQALASVQQRAGRFWVQFRQPEWRDYEFGSQQEMDNFISDKQRNGWDVEVYPGQLRIRYRLTQWGGSRIFDDLGEARAWAAYLDRQLGYQARIVDY